MDSETGSDSDGKYCLNHDLLVEYFCKTHRQSGCAKCVVKDHRGCEDVLEISEDIQKTRQLLSSIQSSILKGVDRFQKEKNDVATEYKNTLDEIDGLTDSLTSGIEKASFEYKRFAGQNNSEANAKLDLKLKKLHDLDKDVQELLSKLGAFESMIDYNGIKNCYNKGEKFENSVGEMMQECPIVYEVKFVPCEMFKKILANDVIIGNTSKTSDSESRPQVAKEDKSLQTCDLVKYDYGVMLENLSKTINGIKQNGHEVVFCIGKLIIAEKRNLKLFDYVNNETLFKVELDSRPSSLITVGSYYIAMILKDLNTILCFKVASDGTMRRHRQFSDANSWTEILTITEGKDGKFILATIKSYETSDFKHPATLTRMHKLFL